MPRSEADIEVRKQEAEQRKVEAEVRTAEFDADVARAAAEAAKAELVAPIKTLPVLTTSSPSQTMQTTGPDAINLVIRSKKGFPRCSS